MTDPPSLHREFPPYTYVPGYAEHPVSGRNGHMRNSQAPVSWSQQQYFDWGVCLFQNGYYWEAHEAWEHVWLGLGRTSDDAIMVKGLIKLAASGVKCREGNATGAIRHASRASELLSSESNSILFQSCNLKSARESADRLAESPPVSFAAPSDRPVPLPELQI